MSGKLKILLSGMIAKVPLQGGLTWVVLQYLLGLRQLGHEVHFLELISDADLVPGGAPFRESSNAAYLHDVINRFELNGSVTLLNIDTMESVGKSHADLLRYANQCDLLLNLSGLLTDQQFVSPIPLRVYIDLDPAFTQLWESEHGVDMGMAGHNRFVTIGMALGQSNCNIPTLGKTWIKTLQPLMLSHWPVAQCQPNLGLTTVANWRGYGSVDYRGVFHGQKAHSLRPFFNLPPKTGETFNLALSIHHDEKSDLEQLNRFGWNLLEPSVVADTTNAFQQFIQQSKAEFGFAKSGYVVSKCGWFSDRSICYLASGRPVIAQDTGFSQFLPTGQGLFSYETEMELLDSITQLNMDYAKHCSAARDIAEEFFDSGKVLTRLLKEIGAT
jgi:hypothetical protein